MPRFFRFLAGVVGGDLEARFLGAGFVARFLGADIAIAFGAGFFGGDFGALFFGGDFGVATRFGVIGDMVTIVARWGDSARFLGEDFNVAVGDVPNFDLVVIGDMVS